MKPKIIWRQLPGLSDKRGKGRERTFLTLPGIKLRHSRRKPTGVIHNGAENRILQSENYDKRTCEYTREKKWNREGGKGLGKTKVERGTSTRRQLHPTNKTLAKASIHTKGLKAAAPLPQKERIYAGNRGVNLWTIIRGKIYIVGGGSLSLK